MTKLDTPIDLSQRVAELENILRMLLEGTDNMIIDGHRLAAEVALYGVEEAVARRMK